MDHLERIKDLCDHIPNKCIDRFWDILVKEDLHPATKSFICDIIDCCEKKPKVGKEIKK